MGDHFTQPFYSIDEKYMQFTTSAMVEKSSLHFPEMYGMEASKHGILPSILAVPLYIAGKWLGTLLFPGLDQYIILFFVFSLNAFVSSLVLVVFYSFSRYLGYPRKSAFYTTVILGTGTILFPYAKAFFSHPLFSLCLLLSLFEFIKYSREKKKKHLFYSSLWFGLLLLTRIDGIVLLVVFLFGLVITGFEDSERSLFRFAKRSVLFFAPILGFVCLHFVIEHLKFGSFSGVGYGNEAFSTHLAFGLYGLLFSSGRGFFIYSPPVILGFLFARRFRKKHSLTASMIVFMVLLRLFLFARWCQWHGGLSWGPRYLVHLVPLVMLFSNETIFRYKRFSPAIRILILVIILIGVGVQITGVLVGPAKFHENIYPLIRDDENELYFIPQLSAVAGHLDLIKEGKIDSFIVSFTDYLPLPLLLFLLVLLIGILIFCLKGLKKLLDLNLYDVIPWKPLSLYTRKERHILGVVLGGIILYAFLSLASAFNYIPRLTLITYKDGTEETRHDFERRVYIDNIGYLPSKAGQKDIELVKMKWQGYIYLPVEGDYFFYIKHRGQYVLSIDEKILSHERERTPQKTIPVKTRFAPGIYRFMAEYIPNDPNEQVFQIYATFPGFGFYKTILSDQYIFARFPSRFMWILYKVNQFKGFLFIFVLMGILLVLKRFPRKS